MKMKKAWNLPTVWVALGAVVLAFISLFMAWVTRGGMSGTLLEIIEEDSEFFAGVMPMIYVSLAWVAVFFLLNHPKLSLIGELVLLFWGVMMVMAIQDTGNNMGTGLILYILAVIVMIVMTFATKKIKKAKTEA